ncbi:MAG: hypothetical protein ACK559_24655 [bacterium]
MNSTRPACCRSSARSGVSCCTTRTRIPAGHPGADEGGSAGLWGNGCCGRAARSSSHPPSI